MMVQFCGRAEGEQYDGGVRLGNLEKYRQQIDRLDEQLLKLLNRRAKVAIAIGRLKQERQSELHAPGREREIFARLEKLNTGPLPAPAIRAVFREIMSASLSLEGPIKVAYLGPKATFTHLASVQHFGSSATYLPATSIPEVFTEVEREHVEYGVVPVENSTEGIVTHTLDMFVESPLKIVGEILQEISHHLMSKSGRLSTIRRIYSHPQALAQCRGWLDQHMSEIHTTEVYSTAKAAELCLEDAGAAAIASELAARLYGLQIVKRRIEDRTHNVTRFLVIGAKCPERTGRDKTSVLFSIKDRVGALYEMLQPFPAHGINLTKIESRPSKKKPWEYLFFVDVEGHEQDPPVRAALEELQGHVLYVKVLGSYPAAA